VEADGPVAVGVDPSTQRLDGRHDVVHRTPVHDGRGLFDRRQIDDGELVRVARCDADRDSGVDDDLVAVRALLVVGQGRTLRGHAGAFELAHQLLVQRLDDRADRGRFEAVGGAGQLGDPYSGQFLDLNVFGWHGALPFDELEPRLDLLQPRAVGPDL